MSRCAYCHRDFCDCGYMNDVEAEYRAEMAREERAYLDACRSHGLVPFSSRDLEPDEARERLEELERARRDMRED